MFGDSEEHDSSFEYEVKGAILVVIEDDFSEVCLHDTYVIDYDLKVCASFFLIDE